MACKVTPRIRIFFDINLVNVLPVLREFLTKGTKSIVISETGNLTAAEYDEFRHKMDASAREKWDQHVTFQPEISRR